MQLRKSAHKANRNRVPCVHCGNDHPTWMHGKSDEAISQELRSRQKNARDPWFVKPVEKPAPAKVAVVGASRGSRIAALAVIPMVAALLSDPFRSGAVLD